MLPYSGYAKSTKTDPNFLTHHLSLPPLDLPWSELEDDDMIQDIEKATTQEEDIYDPLCKILSNYSARIYKSLPASVRHRPKAAYVFLDRHTNHPTHHPYDAKDVPDIVGVEGPCDKWTQAKGKTPVPHYQIVTIVECKPRNKDGRSQLATYAFQLLEARPDLPGAYVAWAAPEGYQILWSDASGVVASEFTPWAQIEMLGAFVYSLYDPPSSHWLRDQSLKPMRAKHQPSDEVLWKIKLKEPRREFTKCQSIFVGNSWGRRTNVFKHGNGHDVAVIKDSYRDTKRRYLEEKLLDEIHEDGIFPGVVRPLFALPPEAKSGIELSKDKTLPRNVPTTAPLDDKKVSRRSTARVKARLVMGSYGDSLNEAQSVLDILKAIYDAIEVHRVLVMERKILHRDISRNNILINPIHNPDAMSGRSLISKPPWFIDDVLACEQIKDGKDRSKALLVDFDNSARYDPENKDKEVWEELAARTGTPMYIARSVASGIRLRRTYTHYHQMPRLSGEAQKFYFAAYSEKEYFDRNDDNDKFHDREMPTNFDDNNAQERDGELDNGDLLDGSRDGDSDDSLGSDDDSDEEELQESEDDSDKEELQESDDASDYDDIPTSDDSPPAPSFHHRPDHDVESFFWVLLATLLRARPKKWKPDPHRKFFWNAYDMFLRHSVEAGKVDDSRAELLSYEADDFKKALHPKLQDLAPMLGKMAQQVYPEYGFMDPPPALDHLHEAMRRLLLEQIVQMQNAKNPIPLTAGSLRPLRMKKPIRKRVEQPDFGGTSAAGDTPSTRGTKRKSGNQKKGGLKKKVKRTYGDKDGRLRHVDA